MSQELECEVEMVDELVDVEVDFEPEMQTEVEIPLTIEKVIQDLKPIALVSGAIDGNNKVFEWEHEPLLIFWAGQKLTEDRDTIGYTLSVDGLTSTHTEAPEDGDALEAYGYYE